MTTSTNTANHRSIIIAFLIVIATSADCIGHGTVTYPASRVYRVYQANPSNPSFQLAANAVLIDGTLSYYTWNEVSRNIPQAVMAGLPPGFDYSPWMPDGQLASAGRVDPNSPLYPRTYAGLDQVSQDWPKTPVTAGSTITVQFLATAPHDPSVWDVWMTKPTWNPNLPLQWSEMEFLGRPTPTLANSHYTFDVAIPTDRSGHHVLWVAWHRNDPAGEVFISTSDIDIQHFATYPGSNDDLLLATGSGGFLSSTPPGDIKDVSINSLWTVQISSPGGTFDNQPAWVVGTGLPAGQMGVLQFGLPDVYVDPNAGWIHLQSNMLTPGGDAITFPVPPWANGQSFLFQGVALGASALNGFYATTDAHQANVVP